MNGINGRPRHFVSTQENEMWQWEKKKIIYILMSWCWLLRIYFVCCTCSCVNGCTRACVYKIPSANKRYMTFTVHASWFHIETYTILFVNHYWIGEYFNRRFAVRFSQSYMYCTHILWKMVSFFISSGIFIDCYFIHFKIQIYYFQFIDFFLNFL